MGAPCLLAPEERLEECKAARNRTGKGRKRRPALTLDEDSHRGLWTFGREKGPIHALRVLDDSAELGRHEVLRLLIPGGA